MNRSAKEKNMNRRKLLTGAAVIGTGAAVSACTTTNGTATVSPAVIDAIAKITAEACNIIPSAVSLVALIAAAFPTIAGAATISAAVANEIASLFCHNTTPVGGTVGAVPKFNNVAVELHGWHIVDGKMTSF